MTNTDKTPLHLLITICLHSLGLLHFVKHSAKKITVKSLRRQPINVQAIANSVGSFTGFGHRIKMQNLSKNTHVFAKATCRLFRHKLSKNIYPSPLGLHYYKANGKSTVLVDSMILKAILPNRKPCLMI